MEEQKVFISHSVKDADWARSFAHALKERGVSVWFDGFDVKSGSLGLMRLKKACVVATY